MKEENTQLWLILLPSSWTCWCLPLSVVWSTSFCLPSSATMVTVGDVPALPLTTMPSRMEVSLTVCSTPLTTSTPLLPSLRSLGMVAANVLPVKWSALPDVTRSSTMPLAGSGTKTVNILNTRNIIIVWPRKNKKKRWLAASSDNHIKKVAVAVVKHCFKWQAADELWTDWLPNPKKL